MIKSINAYDKDKRHQTMNDLDVLIKHLVDEERRGYRCAFIVTLYGAFYDEGRVKVILELMDAGSLGDAIALYKAAGIEPKLAEPLLAKIVLQMLCGLTYLHSKNILHRDVKPANVLLNSKG